MTQTKHTYFREPLSLCAAETALSHIVYQFLPQIMAMKPSTAGDATTKTNAAQAHRPAETRPSSTPLTHMYFFTTDRNVSLLCPDVRKKYRYDDVTASTGLRMITSSLDGRTRVSAPEPNTG